MRWSSILSCGCVPVWEWAAPRLRDRRVRQETARNERAEREAAARELRMQRARLRADNFLAARQFTWVDSPAPSPVRAPSPAGAAGPPRPPSLASPAPGR